MYPSLCLGTFYVSYATTGLEEATGTWTAIAQAGGGDKVNLRVLGQNICSVPLQSFPLWHSPLSQPPCYYCYLPNNNKKRNVAVFSLLYPCKFCFQITLRTSALWSQRAWSSLCLTLSVVCDKILGAYSQNPICIWSRSVARASWPRQRWL